MDRRDFILRTSATGVAGLLGSARAQDDPGTRQATGVKVGEVTDRSALVWMRVTEASGRRLDGILRHGLPRPYPDGLATRDLQSSCPGAPGRVRVSLSTREDMRDARTTAWQQVDPRRDFSHQFNLDGLSPDTVYHYLAETSDAGGKLHAPLTGKFRTAPDPRNPAPISFAMTTCQQSAMVDHPDGFHLYEAMARLDPHFFVSAGDVVYYDAEDPLAANVALARFHWQRMFSYPRHIQTLLALPGYWMKDDHDIRDDDIWPSKPLPPGTKLTFADGLRIFREQVPMSKRPYRTFRWGKTLQIWLVEGREFRSPNFASDWPWKSLWGLAQRRWLKESLLASDADWKILVSPTAMVGPDTHGKMDSHANVAFGTEGRAFRVWARARLGDRFFVLNGDRHWQYHSVHPLTGTHEFSVGAASDAHARGSAGTFQEDPRYHRFHRLLGGFLHVETKRSKHEGHITFRLCDVHGNTVYEVWQSRNV
jgi:alkaline phosphatase D